MLEKVLEIVKKMSTIFFLSNLKKNVGYVSDDFKNKKLLGIFAEMPLSANLFRTRVLNPQACGLQGRSPIGGCGVTKPPAHKK